MVQPAFSNSFKSIKTSHKLDGDSKKLKVYYDKWANNYDTDVGNEQYEAPAFISDFAAFIARAYLRQPFKNISVLDAGCGTRLVGVHLKKRGFQQVDGFDLSPEMTDCAKETGAYGELRSGVDLNQDQPNPLGKTYDLLVCCGVLTLGHVEPESLGRLATYLAPGGCMIISTRNSYLDDGAFEKVSEQLENDGVFESLTCAPDAWYIEEEGAHYWVYRKKEDAPE